LYEIHTSKSSEECRDRHPNRDPAMMHANGKKPREQLRNASLSLVVGFYLLRQDCDAKQRRKQHSNDP
jgi:hypothetical protein